MNPPAPGVTLMCHGRTQFILPLCTHSVVVVVANSWNNMPFNIASAGTLNTHTVRQIMAYCTNVTDENKPGP